MKLRHGTGCLLLLLATGWVAPLAGPADARPLSEADQPAEYPPASYTGSQYVDSRGCVYIRAGFDDAVTWVPRVDRRRQVLCGFTPSAAGGTAVTTAPVIGAPDAGTAPSAISTDPAPAPRIAVPRAAPVPAAGADTPGAPRAGGDAPRQIAGQPRQLPSAEAAPRPGPMPAPIAPSMARSGVIAEASDAPVRVARTEAPRRIVPDETPRRVRTAAGTPAPVAAPTARIAAAGYSDVPRRVADITPGQTIRVAPARGLDVPKGYEPAWTDGRLNPNRGKQTFRGALQTALVWTQTVPRRLVDPRGLDVTETYNYLVYPYTDYAKQKRDLEGGRKVVVRTASGRMIVDRDRIRVSKQSGRTVLIPDTGARGPDRPGSRDTAPAPVRDLSPDNPQLRAAPLEMRAGPGAALPNGGRFVQVGAFAVPRNAHSTAARLMAKGVPARIVPQVSGGRTLDVVLAGPFGASGQLNRTLAFVRKSGFPDAFAR